MDPASSSPPRGPAGFLRRWWPWMVGIAIVVLIGARVPFGSFRDSMARGPHVQLAVFDVVITAIVLGTESIATWLALIAVSLRRRFVDVLVVRGATYLLFLVNYALGQGGFGFYLHRTGTGAQTAVGATLFMIGTNLATLLLLTSAAWAIDGGGVPNAALWWTLTIGCGGFAAYLVVIVAAPAFLAGRVWLAPLFDAGLRGHAIAVLGRVPHIVFIVFSQWLAMRIWGLQVPVSEAMTVVPAIAIAAALPISPGASAPPKQRRSISSVSTRWARLLTIAPQRCWRFRSRTSFTA